MKLYAKCLNRVADTMEDAQLRELSGTWVQSLLQEDSICCGGHNH